MSARSSFRTRGALPLGGWLLPSLLIAAACDKPQAPAPKTADAPSKLAAPAAPAKPARKPEAGQGGGAGRGGGGGDKQGGQAMAYIDGKLVAAIRHPELPAGLKPVCQPPAPGGSQPLCRYRVVDYVLALGVPLTKVKTVALHGGSGRVVALLQGSDLRRQRNAVWFSFQHGGGGKVRAHWVEDIPRNAGVDVMGNLSIYVDKAPPVWNATMRRVELDGRPLTGIPYADPSLGKGTRVYVDGLLVAFVKKKQLPENAKLPAIEGEEEQRWQLGASLDALGIAAKGIKAADLIDEDEFVARLTGDAIAHSAFVIVPESGGHIEVAPHRREISAILMFRRSKPPAR